MSNERIIHPQVPQRATQEKNQNKSAYEIRLEVLKIAADVGEHDARYNGAPPSVELILEYAERLYAFVERK